MQQDMTMALQLDQADAANAAYKQQQNAALMNQYMILQSLEPKTTTGIIRIPGAKPIIYSETTK